MLKGQEKEARLKKDESVPTPVKNGRVV